jgi:membrane fusion protein, multidrug efflux system
MFAVNKGLTPGDRVVVDGADRLRDGAKVLISTAEGSNGGPAEGETPAKSGHPSQHHRGDHPGQRDQP